MNPVYITGQVPSKSNRYSIGIIGGKSKKARASMFKSKKLKDFEKDFKAQLSKHENPIVHGLFRLDIHIRFSNVQSDLDGCFKMILDVLQSEHWIRNDSDCMEIRAKKSIDYNNPGFLFKLERI
jgi:Holliday junction resolvase RusA-like endonuclease